MYDGRLLKSYTIRTYATENSKLTRITISRYTGYGMGQTVNAGVDNVMKKLLLNIFQMLDTIFDFLGDSGN